MTIFHFKRMFHWVFTAEERHRLTYNVHNHFIGESMTQATATGAQSINLLVQEVFVHYSTDIQQRVSHSKEWIWAAIQQEFKIVMQCLDDWKVESWVNIYGKLCLSISQYWRPAVCIHIRTEVRPVHPCETKKTLKALFSPDSTESQSYITPILHYTTLDSTGKTGQSSMWRRGVCSVKLVLLCLQLELRLSKGIFLTTVLFLCNDYTITWLAYSNIMQRSRNWALKN